MAIFVTTIDTFYKSFRDRNEIQSLQTKVSKVPILSGIKKYVPRGTFERSPIRTEAPPALVFEERHATADEDGSHPAAAVDALFKEDAGGDGVGDKGERAGGGCHEAYISMAQGEEE